MYVVAASKPEDLFTPALAGEVLHVTDGVWTLSRSRPVMAGVSVLTVGTWKAGAAGRLGVFEVV